MWVTRSSLSAESQAADLASHYAEAPDFEQVKSNDEVPEETYFAQCTETTVYGDMVQNVLNFTKLDLKPYVRISSFVKTNHMFRTKYRMAVHQA